MKSTFAIRLKEIMNIKSIKAAEIVEKTGIPKSAISQYLSGKFEAKNDRIHILANFFNVDEAWLMGFDVPMEREQPTNAPEPSNIASIIPANKIYQIPVFATVSAGFGAYAAEDVVDYMPIVLTNPHDAPDMLGIRVHGNSMYPKIEDGDTVIVRKQSSVDSGDIAVIMIDGEEGVVKKVVYGETWVELHSMNPKYEVRRFEGAELQRLRVVGLVKGVFKSF